MSRAHVHAEQLRLFIDRIERLDEERQGIADEIKAVYQEAKANGYDTKIIRKVVQRRRMDADARAELDALLESYENALEGQGSLFDNDGSLKAAVGDKLKESGFEHEGGNRWKAPEHFVAEAQAGE